MCGDHPDIDGDAATIDDSAQNIPAHLVGAKPILPARGLQHILGVHVGVTVGARTSASAATTNTRQAMIKPNMAVLLRRRRRKVTSHTLIGFVVAQRQCRQPSAPLHSSRATAATLSSDRVCWALIHHSSAVGGTRFYSALRFCLAMRMRGSEAIGEIDTDWPIGKPALRSDKPAPVGNPD
jgi:hypothetical protein